jgi:hypothetical protein
MFDGQGGEPNAIEEEEDMIRRYATCRVVSVCA